VAKFSLIPFTPINNCDFDLNVEINQNDQAFYISYLLEGNLSQINLDIPTPTKERTLKLWEKTCFELFIQNSNKEYIEFNFSPRFEWNCFYFDKPRSPLLELEKMQYPNTDILLSLNKFFLVAEIKKEFFPDNFFTDQMSVGITSVIKMQDETFSYWALSHEDSRPNFHHYDSFKYKF
jgi:hypothetical protein